MQTTCHSWDANVLTLYRGKLKEMLLVVARIRATESSNRVVMERILAAREQYRRAMCVSF